VIDVEARPGLVILDSLDGVTLADLSPDSFWNAASSA
jgi:hypothetical protein